MSERTQAIWDGLQCDPAECEGCYNLTVCDSLSKTVIAKTREPIFETRDINSIKEILHLRKMAQRLQGYLIEAESIIDECAEFIEENTVAQLGIHEKINLQQSSRQARESWSLYTFNKK